MTADELRDLIPAIISALTFVASLHGLAWLRLRGAMSGYFQAATVTIGAALILCSAIGIAFTP